jgi:diacylglycerol kinase (ATP)
LKTDTSGSQPAGSLRASPGASHPTPLRFSKAALIYNPAARRLRWRPTHKLQAVLERIRSFGIAVEVRRTAESNHATSLAQSALQKSCDLIIACGGDGTVNEVIRGMAGSRVPLMVIPAGTANVLAKEIGLPLDWVESAGLLRTGLVRRIALGRVGSRPFLLMAGIGVDAGVLRALNGGLKTLLGQGAFWIAGLQQLLGYSFPQFEVQVGGESRQATFALISRVRNYGGGFQITGQADLYSEAFQVCLFQSRNRWRYPYYLWNVVRKRHYGLPDVLHLHARSVRADGSREIGVQIDGELIGVLPQTVTIQPDALSLLIPGRGREIRRGVGKVTRWKPEGSAKGSCR